MRRRAMLSVIALGLLAGLTVRTVAETAGFSPLGERDEKIYEWTPEVDPLLALDPPGRFASTQRWVEFGRAVHSIDYGVPEAKNVADRSARDLAWTVYIARQRPAAIYPLYEEGVIWHGRMGYLIQVGLLPDWYERVADPDRLLLSEAPALIHFARMRGVDAARRRFIEAFFAERPPRERDRIVLDLEALRFAVPAMTDAEVEVVVPRLASNVFLFYQIKMPRLLLTGRFDAHRDALRALFRGPYEPSATVASRFSAELLPADSDVLWPVLDDLAAGKPQIVSTDAAPGILTLWTDGLLGAALVDALRTGKPVVPVHAEDYYALEIGGDTGG